MVTVECGLSGQVLQIGWLDLRGVQAGQDMLGLELAFRLGLLSLLEMELHLVPVWLQLERVRHVQSEHGLLNLSQQVIISG